MGGGGPNWGTEAPGSDHNLWEAGNHGQEAFGNVRLAAGFVFFFYMLIGINNGLSRSDTGVYGNIALWEV